MALWTPILSSGGQAVAAVTEGVMIYRLYLRAHGDVVQRQGFEADDDRAAKAIAAAVFRSTTEHWDSYDLWEGSRLVGGPTAEKLDALAGTIEEIAVIIEETIQNHDRFANDQRLAARIREIRDRLAHRTAPRD